MNLFSLMNLCDKCGQYRTVTINSYSSSLSPPLPLVHQSPFVIYTPSWHSIFTLLEFKIFRIHQFNVRLVLAWQFHGKLPTHCTASGMLPRQHALTLRHQVSMYSWFFRRMWGSWEEGFSVKCSTFWPDPLIIEGGHFTLGHLNIHWPHL